MKILLAVVMSLTVATSVWADCKSTPSDCADEAACKKENHTWKPAVTTPADKAEAAHCIKTPDKTAGQTPSVCPGVVNTNAGKEASGTDASKTTTTGSRER